MCRIFTLPDGFVLYYNDKCFAKSKSLRYISQMYEVLSNDRYKNRRWLYQTRKNYIFYFLVK